MRRLSPWTGAPGLLVLLVALSGCGQPDAGEAGPSASSAAASSSVDEADGPRDEVEEALLRTVDLQDCRLVFGFFQVPRGAANQNAPRGTVVAGDASSPSAASILAAVSCETTRIGDAEYGPALFYGAAQGLRMPDEYAQGETTTEQIFTGYWSSPPELEAVFAAWNLSAGPLDSLNLGPSGASGRVTASGPGLAFELTLARSGGFGQPANFTSRLYCTVEGVVVNAVDLQWINATTSDPLGPATVTLSEGLEDLYPARSNVGLGGDRFQDIRFVYRSMDEILV